MKIKEAIKYLIMVLFLTCIAVVSYKIQEKGKTELRQEIESKNEAIEDLKLEVKELKDYLKYYKKEVDDLNIKNNTLEKRVEELSKARYDNNDLTIKSNVTKEQLYNVLDGTNMQQLSGYIVDAEKKYGVNALFLTGLIAQETGFGSSRRFKEDNNVGGYEVYTVSSKGRIFDSKADSVYAVARLLSKHYLSDDGKYYNGKSSYDVNRLYCTESAGGQFEWHKNIDNIAVTLKEEINKKDTD